MHEREREIELSVAAWSSADLLLSPPHVQWLLQCSKSNLQASDKARTWACTCHEVSEALPLRPPRPCAYHAVLGQRDRYVCLVGPEAVAAGNLPVFPTQSGCAAPKEAVVSCVEEVAGAMELLTTSAYDDYALRATGAQRRFCRQGRSTAGGSTSCTWLSC